MINFPSVSHSTACRNSLNPSTLTIHNVSGLNEMQHLRISSNGGHTLLWVWKLDVKDLFFYVDWFFLVISLIKTYPATQSSPGNGNQIPMFEGSTFIDYFWVTKGKVL